MHRTLAVLAVIAVACLAAASTAGARSSGRLCPVFKKSGKSFTLQTVGTAWSCGSAKGWAVKLIGDKVNAVSRNVPLKNGPSGYHCFAEPGSHGRATNGACIKGTIAFPKSGFAWMEK